VAFGHVGFKAFGWVAGIAISILLLDTGVQTHENMEPNV
jgi:hypothetical protein